MIKRNLIVLFAVLMAVSSYAQDLFEKNEVLKDMLLANSYFMDKWPDTGTQ